MANSPVMRPLAGVARMFAAMRSKLYAAPPVTIAGVNPQNWPSANQPVQPVGPPGSQPLLWSLYQGTNLNISPRPDAPLTFQDLRNLATYPLARICIENVKDTISSLDWKIKLVDQPGEAASDRDKRQATDKNVPALTEFFKYPDGETPWKDWVRPLLEDLLVIDAPTILLQRTMTGSVVKLRVPDGADFLRLIDDTGGTPAAPSPAYTQLWDGVPRVLLTTDQLVYRPRNIARRGTVASQLYGFGATEQLAQEIQTGMERSRFVLAYYTDGSVPGVIQLTAPSVDPDKILEAMRSMNSDIAGDLAKRRNYRWSQSLSGDQTVGPKDQIIQLKEPILADAYDELHIRKIAFGYGASAQRLLKAMNRASAQAGQEAAEEEGSYPILQWLKSTIDLIIQRKMGFANYELVFDTSKELDPEKQSNIDKTDISTGKVTIDETREAKGLKPFGLPETSQPMVITATGPVPLAGAIDRTQQAHTASLQPKIVQMPGQPGGAPQPNGPRDPAPAPAPKKKVSKGLKDGMPEIDPDHYSPKLHEANQSMQAAIWKFFQHAAIDLKVPVKKALKADDDPADRYTDDILSDVVWSGLVDGVEPDLNAAAVEGASIGLAGLQISGAAVISSVNALAQEYAKARAAEMVGMKWVDGELVTNPNAEYAISETTRTMVRRIVADSFAQDTPIADIVQQIKDSPIFSEDRATLIARTEVSQAQVAGNYGAWAESGVVEEVRWQLSGDHDQDDECDENMEAGSIKIGEEFPSGDKHPLAHPRCNCILVASKIKGVEL